MCCGVCALSVHVYCDSFHVPYTVLQNACISSRMKYLYIGGGANVQTQETKPLGSTIQLSIVITW